MFFRTGQEIFHLVKRRNFGMQKEIVVTNHFCRIWISKWHLRNQVKFMIYEMCLMLLFSNPLSIYLVLDKL